MFSGIGGFDLALNRLGHECAGYCEIDKFAIQTYEKNFGKDVKNYGDATKIRTDRLPDFDLLCAGFPCQTFSIAGKRRGFQDTRGTLFFEIERILRAKRPAYFLLENVKGLFSHDGGKTFATIIRVLESLGYCVEWMVLNSKFFGVPQNRERIFFVGNLGEESKPEILPFKKGIRKTDRVGPVARAFTAGGHSGGLHSQMTGIAHCLDSNYNKGITDLKKSTRTVIYDMQHKKVRKYEGTTPTLCERMGTGGNNVPMITSHWRRKGNPKDGGTGPLHSEEFAFCIDRTPHVVNKIRRLTPTECERLQGFPDGWTEGVSDTQRYKQLGNAVTVNVISAIVERLRLVKASK